MDIKITGIHIYYYIVCKRKLWYYCHGIQMENNSEYVALGKITDENSYSREDKHININNVINIDCIKDNKICETKKTKSIEEASIMQLKFYLYYLKKNKADGFTGELDFPEQKQKKEVILTEQDETKLETICEEIQKINKMEHPPSFNKKRICKKCAYYELCAIV